MLKPGSLLTVVIWLCLIAMLPCNTQGSSNAWAPLSEKVTAESLAAQRQEIAELKKLFAKIDRRIEEIAKIQQRIEALIDNREATTACTALDILRYTEVELSAKISAATTDADRAKLRKELTGYRAILVKAKALTNKLGCRE